MDVEKKVISDLGKGVTYGDADGPDIFVPEFGFMVPSFINPRIDLIHTHTVDRFKRLSYHVPFKYRGHFTGLDWPEKFRSGIEWRENDAGLVLCNAHSAESNYRRGCNGGDKCRSKAVNRSRYCRSHGGALHPLDKKMSINNTIVPPPDRVSQLNRPQKFMQGFLDISEISDEEIQGMFLYNDDGTKCSSMVLGVKIHQQLASELHRRMNRFLQTKTASMLNVMVDIAESELVEPADRIKAATWVAERTLGKTPDVVMHGKIEAPYEDIFQAIDAGSRENYRKEISSTRLELGGEPGSFVDVEVIEESEDSGGAEGDRGDTDSDRGQAGNGGGSEPDVDRGVESAHRLEQRRDEVNRQQEIKKSRVKAKQRRFAARAVGATTIHDMPWVVEWKFLIHGKDKGYFRLKPVCPDAQTEAKLASIEKSNAQALVLAEQWRNNAKSGQPVEHGLSSSYEQAV